MLHLLLVSLGDRSSTGSLLCISTCGERHFPAYEQIKPPALESSAAQASRQAQTQTLLTHGRPKDRLRMPPQNFIFSVFSLT